MKGYKSLIFSYRISRVGIKRDKGFLFFVCMYVLGCQFAFTLWVDVSGLAAAQPLIIVIEYMH